MGWRQPPDSLSDSDEPADNQTLLEKAETRKSTSLQDDISLLRCGTVHQEAPIVLNETAPLYLTVRTYSSCASSSSSFLFVVCFILAFCHFDIDVCIYSNCAFLIVKWILMLIMYSAASS